MHTCPVARTSSLPTNSVWMWPMCWSAVVIGCPSLMRICSMRGAQRRLQRVLPVWQRCLASPRHRPRPHHARPLKMPASASRSVVMWICVGKKSQSRLGKQRTSPLADAHLDPVHAANSRARAPGWRTTGYEGLWVAVAVRKMVWRRACAAVRPCLKGPLSARFSRVMCRCSAHIWSGPNLQRRLSRTGRLHRPCWRSPSGSHCLRCQ